MKKKLILLAAAAAATLITACMPEEGTTKLALNPDFSEIEADDVELDFIELNNDTIDYFGEAEGVYAYISSLDIDGDNHSRTIYATAEAGYELDEYEGELFSAALLKRLNDAAVAQYPGFFELSSEESFGTLFDLYAVEIIIYDEEDGSTVYELTLEPGDETDLNTAVEAYEEEWYEYMELYYSGVIDTLKQSLADEANEEAGDDDEEDE